MTLRRRISALLGRGGIDPGGRTFVAYAYSDDAALVSLVGMNLNGVELAPFPPVNGSPETMVSDELLAEIDASDSFIFIDTESARRSRWVALETDYARRLAKPVFRFDPGSRTVTLDRGRPKDLSAFPSFSREDQADVEEILKIMKTRRFFDVFDEREMELGQNIFEGHKQGLVSRLERGGFVVVFWSEAAAGSLWVKIEVKYALERFPRQILMAPLGDVDLDDLLAENRTVPLRRVEDGGFDMRDIDDLVVWLYWLIGDPDETTDLGT